MGKTCLPLGLGWEVRMGSGGQLGEMGKRKIRVRVL